MRFPTKSRPRFLERFSQLLALRFRLLDKELGRVVGPMIMKSALEHDRKAAMLTGCILAVLMSSPIGAASSHMDSSRTTRGGVRYPIGQSYDTTSTNLTAARLAIPLITAWQWQLASTPTGYISGVTLYDVDSGTSAAVIADMHAHGIAAVCYFSAGTVDAQYPDAARFPVSVLGDTVQGWPNERWLDYTQTSIVTPLMEARFQLCASKGFDAVEADNVDGYTNNTGFALTYQTQITYNSWLANTAHRYGLSIALKNDPAQVRDLVGVFDWSLVEECFDFNECDQYLPFISVGKPVMEVEYNLTPVQFCSQANAMHFNAMVKHASLDAYRVACRDALPPPAPTSPPIPLPRSGGGIVGTANSPPPQRSGGPALGIPNPRPSGR